MMVQILTEPENAQIKQYKLLFAKNNVQLEFTDAALTAIGEMAMQRQTGARGIGSILVNTVLLFNDFPCCCCCDRILHHKFMCLLGKNPAGGDV